MTQARSGAGSARGANVLFGVVLLVLLAIFAGPNLLPRLISQAFPQAYEGTSCDRLRVADERAYHQSLLGRNLLSPIELGIATSTLPAAGDGFLYVRIVIVNNSLGTIPIVFNPLQVTVGDNGSSGVGLLFTPQNSLYNATRQDPATFAETNLRLLGPRQRCAFTVEFPGGNVLVDPALANGQATVRAFYRNNSPGTTVQTNPLATPIFRDQGLWTGYVESPPVPIPLPLSTG